MQVRKQIIGRRTVLRLLDLDREVLDHLEELQIVIPVQRRGRERGYSIEDVDNLRVYQLLVRDLGVNSAGAEIILRMRGQLLSMHQRISLLLSHARAQGLLEDLRSILASLERDLP